MKMSMRCVGVAILLNLIACGGGESRSTGAHVTFEENGPADEQMEPATTDGMDKPEDNQMVRPDAMDAPTSPEPSWQSPEQVEHSGDEPVEVQPPQARPPSPLLGDFEVCAREPNAVEPPDEGFVSDGLIKQLRVDDRGAVHALVGDSNNPSTYHLWTGDIWVSPELPEGMRAWTIAAQGFPVVVRERDDLLEVMCLDADLETWHSVIMSNPAETFLPGTEYQDQPFNTKLDIHRHGNATLTYSIVEYLVFAEDEAACGENAQNNWCESTSEDCCMGKRFQEVVVDLTTGSTLHQSNRPSETRESYEYTVSTQNMDHDGVPYGLAVSDSYDTYHGYYLSTSLHVWAGEGDQRRGEIQRSWSRSFRASRLVTLSSLHRVFALHAFNPDIPEDSPSSCATIKPSTLPYWTEDEASPPIEEHRSVPPQGTCTLTRNEAGAALTAIQDSLQNTLEVEDVSLALDAAPHGKAWTVLDTTGNLHLLYTDHADHTLKHYQHTPRFDRLITSR